MLESARQGGTLVTIDPRYAVFPNSEYERRHKAVSALMREQGIDALLVTSKENVIYFSGIQTIEWISKHRPMGFLIPVAPKKPLLVIPETLVAVARETSWVTEVRPWGAVRIPDSPADPVSALQLAVHELGLEHATIGFEHGYGQFLRMPKSQYDDLLSRLPGVKVVDGADAIWRTRAIKSDLEAEALRRVCAATDRAFEECFAALHEGMSEREIAGLMFARMAKETGEQPEFMMVRSGKTKYGMSNVPPFDKAIEKGDLVVIDAGARYKNYVSDFMRMACVGQPSKDQRYMFDADLESQIAGVEAVKPGATTGDVFDACYKVLTDRKLTDHAKLARVGHGIGLEVHEWPSVDRGGTIPLEPGMVITVEPIFSDRPNAVIGNFALEDLVLVTKTGHEVLSKFPKELHLV
jgi:Xaa-Pro dipeptidase